MEPITIYHSNFSPVARSVVFLTNYLKINAEFKKVDIASKEHLQDWYLKLNPQHTVPTLVDNDFTVTESRAILSYLVNSKTAGSSLYATDPKKRALIDCRLYFDATVLGSRSSNLGRDIMFKGKTEVDPKDKESLLEGFAWLNDFLKGNKWVAGDELSIADFSIVGTVSAFFYLNDIMNKYPEVKRWYGQFKSFDGFEQFSQGAKGLAQLINSKLPNGF